MAIMEGYISKEFTIKMYWFNSIMQQKVIENEFNREYTSLATIQQRTVIEFFCKRFEWFVPGSTQLAPACARQDFQR